MQNNKLDLIDKKILNILMVEAKKPLKEIAEVVFLSIPAVSARIEKMEKAGYIRGYQAQVDPLLTGYPVKAFIHLAVPQAKKDSFYAYVRECYQIIECNGIMGEYSILIQACFLSMEELECFTEELQRFGKTRTEVATSTQVWRRGIQIKE